jgi:predicted phosphodiesterase
MRTLIISDLHLGSVSGSDVLRRAELREPLLEALADVDRLVLLGDVLELRHGPVREALAAARPFFEALGDALAGRELVIVAGNHDHALVEPWLARRGAEDRPAPLGLEQLLDPQDVSPAYERIAGWASPASVLIAYPGLWVRPDVYATHGHYLDCHLTIPTLERLSVGAMSRLLGRPADAFETVADYEAIGSPVFAWRDAVARDGHTGSTLNGMATVSAWSALRGDRHGQAGARGTASSSANGRRPRRSRGSLLRELRRRALVAAFPLAVAALNRAGLGPLSANISGTELRRAGLRAMDEVAVHLGLGDAHVVFGHTHRAGPLAGDEMGEWRGRDGARLLNAGSWTYAGIFLTPTPGESPYWPGSGVLVEDDGPPQLLRLLQDRTREQIRPPRVRSE